ncbi:MAG: hypothetical protein IPN95_31700 [Bacteroidetes bacterium]|nr:hypothetical protein [Bacteroidota bacterium]
MSREMTQGIRDAGYDVQLYTSPPNSSPTFGKHSADLVFPYWQGIHSKNRHALNPAICEAAGLKYIGGDAFAKSICNDKHVTKLLCRDFGLDTPASFAIRDASDLHLIDELRLPLVVKPMFEGSSLGITQRNLVRDHATARALALDLPRRIWWSHHCRRICLQGKKFPSVIGYGDYIREWAAGRTLRPQ